MPRSLFSLFPLLLSMRPVLKFASPLRVPWSKLIFTCKWLAIGDNLWVRDGSMCQLFFWALVLFLVQTCPGPEHRACLWVYMYILLCLEGIVFIVLIIPLTLKCFPHPFQQVSRRDLMKKSCLRLSVPRSPTLHTVWQWVSVCIPICCRRKYLWWFLR